MSREQLLEEALQLTDGDRLELAGQLLATVASDPQLTELDDEAEFLRELDRRANDGSAHSVVASPSGIARHMSRQF